MAIQIKYYNIIIPIASLSKNANELEILMVFCILFQQNKLKAYGTITI